MFEDSLFATNRRPSPQRGIAAVLSFAVQAICLAALVLSPLIYTDAVPLGALKTYVEIPLPPGPRSEPPPTELRRPPRPHTSNFENHQLVQPIAIPPNVTILHEDLTAVPPPPGNYIPGNIGGGRGPATQIFGDLLASNMRPVLAPSANTRAKLVPVSTGVSEGLLVRRITPVYPHLAQIGHIQGTVVLHAIIGRDGTIQNLQVVSGHPLLVKAAMDAVEQWRYRPYMLNGEPVDVETQITVNFTLGG